LMNTQASAPIPLMDDNRITRDRALARIFARMACRLRQCANNEEARNPPGIAAGREHKSERCFHQRLLMFKPCKEAS
jgi:hypothetical protein